MLVTLTFSVGNSTKIGTSPQCDEKSVRIKKIIHYEKNSIIIRKSAVN